MKVNYIITDSIAPEEYMKLREAVGWGLFPLEEAEAGLSNSYIWCLRDNEASGKPIGIGRVIWDHGYVMYIADIIVIPEYQGKGIGTQAVRFVKDHYDWKRLTLVTPLYKRENVRFYTEKCGFRIVGTEKDGNTELARFLMER